MKHSNFKRALCLIISAVMLVCCTLINANAKTIMRGDVNGDGQITADDARLALRAAATLEVLEGDALIAADVDESGDILAGDARTILRVSAALEQFDDPDIVIEEETTTEAPETTTEAPETTTEAPETTTEAPETTTEAPTTEEPTTEEPVTGPVEIGRGEYPEAIDALFSGNFYMKSNIENEDGSVSSVEMAIKDDKMEIVMPMDGMQMAVLFDGDTTYVKIKIGIWYVSEITDDLKDQGMDFDVSNMMDSFQYGNIDNFKSIVKYNDMLDNTEYTVYSFISENDNDLCFYADGNNNIKSIITKDATGKITSRNDVEALSADIPNSMFKTSGWGYLTIDLEGLMNMMNNM